MSDRVQSLLATVCTLVLVVGVVYVGGFVAHVLTRVAVAGWDWP